MKHILLAGVVAAAGYMAYREYGPKPPAPLPPPPPAILSEPAPVINEAEQAKILKSAEDMDPSVRWEAALLLDKIKSPQAMPVLFYMLRKDLDAPVRIKAAQLLGDRRGPEAVNALVESLRDQEPDVRLAVLRALEKIGDYSVAGVIATGPIKDPEESVRLQALKTLNALQDKRQAEIDAARARYEQEKAAAAAAAKK
jgi:HEAT repeat protein